MQSNNKQKELGTVERFHEILVGWRKDPDNGA